jgi:hypothetical protein
MQNILIPISDLPGKYQVSRQTVYDRMKFLSISTTKIDNKNHITNDDLELLDQLDEHLATGADKALFKPSGKPTKPKSAIVKQSPSNIVVAPMVPSQPEPTQLVIPDLIEQLAKAINQNSNPLANYDALEKACSNNWIISTHKVYDLIGSKPHGNEYVWGSWRFIAKGKLGRGKGWLVEKIV